MTEQLPYSPEHYRERLSAYAKDTIEYQTTNRFIRYKINKNENPAVVEELDDHFKIYISEKPMTTLFLSTPGNAGSGGSFFALVRINKDVNIKVYWDKFILIAFILWIGFLFYIGIVSSYVSFVFSIPLVLVAYLSINRSKKRFKTFVVTFLNTIAA